MIYSTVFESWPLNKVKVYMMEWNRQRNVCVVNLYPCRDRKNIGGGYMERKWNDIDENIVRNSEYKELRFP